MKMKHFPVFTSGIVVMLTVFVANPVYADMTLFVSGDTNIINPLTGYHTAIDTGNQQFFSNALQGGSTVAILQSGLAFPYSIHIDEYYNSLSGVSSSIFTGTVTTAQLSGVDLFFVVLPVDDFTASEISVMSSFLYNSGNLFFIGEHSGYSVENSRINNALTGLGSSLSIVDSLLDPGFTVATGSQIASDLYTAGVSTFKYGGTSAVSGGTTLFYGTGGQPFVTYEVVPVPGAVLLGILGLSVAGVKLRKFA